MQKKKKNGTFKSKKEKGKVPALQWQCLWCFHRCESWCFHQNRTGERIPVVAEALDSTVPQSTFRPEKTTHIHIHRKTEKSISTSIDIEREARERARVRVKPEQR